MTTTRRRRSPPPPPPLPTGAAQEIPAQEVPAQEVPAPLSGSASPSLTGAPEHEAPTQEQPVLVAEQVVAQPVPVAAPPAPETAEIATVRTRYPHPLFIASQHKVVSPGEEVPVIVDSWVRHHLNHPNGALVRV